MRLSTPQYSVLILLAVGAALLAVRTWMIFGAPPSDLLDYAGGMGVVEGIVADDPDARATATRVTLEVETLNTKLAEGRVLAVLPRGTKVAYGDFVEVRGVLAVPESFETNTGRIFDYPGYLHARGITLLVERAQLRSIEEGGWSLMRGLFFLKHIFERALERVIQEPQAALMEGLLLGEKSGLSKDLTQAFVLTGLVHIVVLSGYNIGVVAEWTLRLLSLLFRKRTALVVAGVVIVSFALMAGGGMATARACLMGLIALLARYLNRPAAALRALGVAAYAMALWNPLVLTDVGFILSVLATFGLITLSPWIEEKLAFLPAGGVRSTAATTIAVQLYVLPALLYFTGVLSLVSLPLNVLVLPLVPVAMLLGFVAGMLALVHVYLALVPGLLASMLLGVIIKITEASAALPIAAYIVPTFSVWVVVAAYVPLTAFAIWRYLRSAAQPPANLYS